jgi:hypothetical protein
MNFDRDPGMRGSEENPGIPTGLPVPGHISTKNPQKALVRNLNCDKLIRMPLLHWRRGSASVSDAEGVC